ncbi:MAG: Cj0069 family protein [Chloroflexi bacterium]|nr:Cj0069 family protein [Chloroflexota bacterium]
MKSPASPRIAILYPGDAAARENATVTNNRFADLFQAFHDTGARPEPAVYSDDFYVDVREQLLQVDTVLVWVNPIHEGRDRTVLDTMLREVAAAGVFVSSHPDIILKMGTKRFSIKQRGWSGVLLIRSYITRLRICRSLWRFPAAGEVRVLKQYRGHSGNGVWKVEAPDLPDGQRLTSNSRVLVQHAQRGEVAEEIPFSEFLDRCKPYFANGGKMIDQRFQPRLQEGMLRCYLVHDQVAGFGFQSVNALYPPAAGQPVHSAPQPGPRHYFPPTMPEAQRLKQKMETGWIQEMQRLLDIPTHQLPVLWDADFLFGPRTAVGEDSYVLCEINVSSVAPFPNSAIPFIVAAVMKQAQTRGIDE